MRELATIHGRTIFVDLWYPRCDEEANEIEIDLVCVRAADPIRVSYDFDRNGWAIKQSKSFYDDDDLVIEWHETAFLPAWALEEKT